MEHQVIILAVLVKYAQTDGQHEQRQGGDRSLTPLALQEVTVPHGILTTGRGKSSARAAGVNIVPQTTEKTENMGAHTRGLRIPTWGPAAPCEAPPSRCVLKDDAHQRSPPARVEPTQGPASTAPAPGSFA